MSKAFGNSLLANELNHYISRRKRGNKFLAALKIDMSKAFDRVSWEFLLAILTHMGFLPHWINLIKQCVTIVSYFVLVNGSLSAPFTPSSSLRQGDPLSPYLFILYMEALLGLLQHLDVSMLCLGIKL